MGGVSWAVHNKLKDESEKQKKEIEELNRQKEELRKRYEERQNELKIQQELKEKEEREFQNRRTMAIQDMNSSLQKKQEEELALIEQEMQKLSQKWCEEEIKEIDLEKLIKDCYQKLIIGENLNDSIKENVKELIKILIQQNEIKHLNLQIIGKTGVGKSTLVNAIFGEKVAEVKKGEPCTMETKCYESKKYNFIRIYDTRGIEISKNFDIEKVFNETLKDIKEKCEKNEPDNLIHCLLYCFTGTRFEREEGEILVKLRKTYEGKKLPIIMVLTQDIEEEEEDEEDGFKQLYNSINKIMEEKCGESLSDNVSHITLIKILAKEKKISKKVTIPPKGLDILIEKCLEKGEYSSKFASFSAVKFSAEKKIKEDFLKIKKEIFTERDRFLDVFFQKNTEDKIFEDIIEKVFITFSLLKHRELVTKPSFDIIKNVNMSIIKLILDKEYKIFNDFIEEKANHMATALMDEQSLIGKKYEFGFGDAIKDSSEFSYKMSKLLKSKFKEISKVNAIKNAAKILSLTIIDIFMNCFVESYLREIKNDDNQTFLENSIKGCFPTELKSQINGLIDDLKKYQEEKEEKGEKEKK